MYRESAVTASDYFNFSLTNTGTQFYPNRGLAYKNKETANEVCPFISRNKHSHPLDYPLLSVEVL